MSLPVLKKESVKLRPVMESDVKLRLKYGINESFASMIGLSRNKIGQFTDEDAKEWYQRVKKHPCKWIIEYNNIFVGAVSLRPEVMDNKGRFAIEIYDENMYNKGIGSKALSLVLDYAFNHIKYHKVYLRALDYNERAKHVYEKFGFVKEGIDREGACIDGKYYSDVYMGILRRDYLKE